MKTIVFRFDIDTHVCIRDGVPALIELSQKHGVKFSFFMNFGKSVSIPQSLGLRKKTEHYSQDQAAHLPARVKLGIFDYLFAAIFNPNLSRYTKQLRSLFNSENEIGLHGGRNHEIWASQAPLWGKEKILNEIKWGLSRYRRFSESSLPNGFASPAWSTSILIQTSLIELGFKYLADKHELNEKYVPETKDGLFLLQTNLLAEPAGVAFFENQIACGFSENQIIENFFENLEKNYTTVVYDHPYVAGKIAIGILDRILEQLPERGFQVKTLSETFA